MLSFRAVSTGLHLVGVFAHPDDESWSAGGVLAACSRAGHQVTVLTATRGESGTDVRGELSAGAALGELRVAELQGACKRLGAQSRLLELADGQLEVDRCRVALEQALDELHPDVLLTLGTDGGYGHRDHTALTQAALRSTHSARRVVTLEFPAAHFEPVRRALRRLGVIDPEVHDLGIDRDEAHLVFTLGELQSVKREAVECHASQTRSADEFLRPGILAPLLTEEWMRVAAGEPLPDDACLPTDGL